MDEILDYPVRMYCPFTHKNETVFFHPVAIKGEVHVDINSFNGCGSNWHRCPQCEACKYNAYNMMFKTE